MHHNIPLDYQTKFYWEASQAIHKNDRAHLNTAYHFMREMAGRGNSKLSKAARNSLDIASRRRKQHIKQTAYDIYYRRNGGNNTPPGAA